MQTEKRDTCEPLDVIAKIEGAMKTLQLMPKVGHKDYKCQWPEHIRDFWEIWRLYATESAYDKPTRIVPTAKQIGELDEVLGWFWSVPKETTQIIWARALNRSWRDIGFITGLAPNTCRTKFRIGVVVLAHHVKKKNNACTNCTENAISVNKLAEVSLTKLPSLPTEFPFVV